MSTVCKIKQSTQSVYLFVRLPTNKKPRNLLPFKGRKIKWSWIVLQFYHICFCDWANTMRREVCTSDWVHYTDICRCPALPACVCFAIHNKQVASLYAVWHRVRIILGYLRLTLERHFRVLMWLGSDTSAQWVENTMLQVLSRKEGKMAGLWGQLWTVMKKVTGMKSWGRARNTKFCRGQG